MARYKDVNWTFPDSGEVRWSQIPTAILMDIRDELKSLNALLHCGNFQRIPTTLRTISRNTHKPKKRKAKSI